MRSFTVYGTKDGNEEYVTVVHSAAEGKTAHEMMKTQNYFDTIRVRDCLGGLCFERDLKTGEKVA